MGFAKVASNNIARWYLAVLLATFWTLAATGAIAEGASGAPAQTDSHLTSLSQAELTELLRLMRRQEQFSKDEIASFKAFLRERASGENKQRNGKPLTSSEQTAISAGTFTWRAWVANVMRSRGWNNIGTAGTTDQFNRVELPPPPAAGAGGSAVQTAYAVEQRRITILHEAVHVADHNRAAGKLGLDLNKWRAWGMLEATLTTLLDGTYLSPRQLGHALWNFEDFDRNNPNVSNDGRYFAGEVRRTFSKAQIDVLIWLYKSRVKIDAYRAHLRDPVRGAESEVRAYRRELSAIQARISAITALISTATTGGSKSATPARKTKTPRIPQSGTPKTVTPKEPKTVTPKTKGTGTSKEPKTATPVTPKTETPKSTSQAPGGGYGDSEGASCFTVGTKVLMADGTSKNIEDVRIGDRVRGKDGAVNKVTGIERPKLGKRLLYAINGGRAFVTAEHPFWTASGWKSIDPRATFAENPRLRVGALAVGDRVAMMSSRTGRRLAAGGGATFVSYAPASLQTIAIRSILGVTGDPDMRVYNLLLDGNHSYFADGYLVHNKG